MRLSFLSYVLTILFLVILASLVVWVFDSFSDKEENIAAPLPSSLTILTNKQVSTLDLWTPLIEAIVGSQAPVLSAESALTYDIVQNKTLYAKNPDTRLPMASLTKIMTAIVALENKKIDDAYLVHASDLVGENVMGLTAREVLTLEDLLYGLILPSGNDAAETLASNYVSGRSGFIRAMNDKAKALGLQNTNFTNPSGLQGDGDQYTTVSDLLVMTRYALSIPLFAKVAATVEHEIPYTIDHKYFYLFNETNLLTSYPGVKGVKDGYTPEAGLCLVTYLDYDGHKIIGVILGSNNRRAEMKELLDYSLKSIGVTPPKHD